MIQKSVRESYATTALDLAAFLLARGHEVTIISLDNGRHEFQFPIQAEADVMAFQRGAPMSARLYAAHARDLRELIRGPRGSAALAPDDDRGNRR